MKADICQLSIKGTYFLGLFILIGLSPLYAQVAPTIEWENTLQTNEFIIANAIISTSDGGFLVTGAPRNAGIGGDKTEPSQGNNDFWLIKLDSDGNVEWDKTLGGIESDAGIDVHQTIDGGYILSGQSYSPISGDKTLGNLGDGDIWLVKVDAIGNIEWQKNYGGTDNELSIKSFQTMDGGYLISAESRSGVSEFKSEPNLGVLSDFWLVKTDVNGNIEWENTIGGNNNEEDPSIALTKDGGYIIAGASSSGVSFDKTAPSKGGSDVWVVKLNSTGIVEWDRTYGGNSNERYFAIDQYDGGYVFAGATYSGATGDLSEGSIGGADYWIVRLDENGALIWENRVGGDANDIPADIVVQSDGTIVVTGRSESGISGDKTSPNLGSYDYWTVALDANGNLLWDADFGGSGFDAPRSIDTTANSGLILNGQSYSGIGQYKSEPNLVFNDLWVVKLGCVAELDTLPNDISPLSQTACINGQPLAIYGSDDNLLSDDLVSYQWQSSVDNVNWINLNNGFLQNYIPEPTAVTTYYRRIAQWGCSLADTSEVHTLNINSDIAPTADAGTVLMSFCPGGSVTIGGSPTASGGTLPYTYAWEPAIYLNDASIANPIATMPLSGITYTLSVTDDNGCLVIDQVQIREITSNAGPDQTICAGSKILLGNSPVISNPAIDYDWNLISGDGFPVSATSNAQLLVNPTINSSYEMVITGPDGCPSRDTVNVFVIAAPFADASPDTAICEGTMATIGTPGVAGFRYYWRALDDDNSFLDDNLVAQPIYDGRICPPGASTTYLLSVIDTMNVCGADYDTITVSVIRANAGDPDPVCAPAFLGEPKPDSDFDYLWTVTSGDFGSIILGAETDSVIYVSPNVSTDYQLEVTYDGVTCIDTRTVGLNCGICVNDSISVRVAGVCEGDQFLQTLPQDIGRYIDTTLMQVRWEGDSLHVLSATNVGEVQIIDTVYNDLLFDMILSDLDGVDLCTLRYYILAGTFTPIVFNPIPASRCADGSAVNVGDVSVMGFNYSWTPSEYLDDPTIANPLASPPETTVYQVEVEDLLTGCISRFDNTITVIPNTSIDAGPDYNFCDGAILSFGPIAQLGFSYSWSPGVGLADPNAATQIDTLYTSLTYVLTAVDTVSGLNCMAIDTVVFTETSRIQADAGSGGTYCPDNPNGIQLGTTDSTAFGYIYQWIPTEGLDDPNSPRPIATPNNTTTYTLIVSAAGGGCEAFSFTTVNVTTAEDLGLSSLSDDTICEGDSVQIGLAPVVGYLYEWFPTDSLSCTDCAQPYAFPSTTTSYSVVVNDTTNCLTDTLSLVINVNPAPEGISADSETICEGDSIQIAATNMPVYTFSWSPSTDLSCTTCSDPYASPSTTTTYYVTTNTGICSVQDSIVVNVNPAPPADAGLDQAVCDAAVTIGTASPGGVVFSWSPSAGLSDPFIAQPDALPNDTTLYFLTLINTTTGCRAIDTVEVAPAFNLELENMIELCLGESRTIGGNSVPGYTYSWSPTTELDNPNIANPTVTPTASRAYTLTVNNNAGCLRMVTIDVIVDTPADVSLTGPDVFCQNACGTLMATLNSGQLSSFSWSPVNGLTNPTQMNTEVCPTETTTYTFTAQDAQGCAINEEFLVNVAPIPAPTVDAGPDTLLCAGESVVLGTAAQSNLTYSWSPVGGLTPSAYVAQPFFSPVVDASSYTLQLTVTDTTTFCTNTDEVIISFQELAVEAGANQSFCNGDSITLNSVVTEAVGAITYNWAPTTGLSCTNCASPKAAPSAVTTYTLTITDNTTNCTAADLVTITPYGVKPPSVDLDDIIFCDRNLDIKIDLDQNDLYTYNWTLLNATGVTLTNETTASPDINTGTDTEFQAVLTITDTTEMVCNTSMDTVYLSLGNFPLVNLPDVVMCPGENFVTLGPDPVDVSEQYTYEWFPSTNLSATNIVNPVATITSDMTYAVNIDYPNLTDTIYEGCELLENVVVDVVGNIPVDAGEDVFFCSDLDPAIQIGAPVVYQNEFNLGTIYFTNVDDNSVFSMPIDGSAAPSLLYNTINSPIGIDYRPATNQLYIGQGGWTEGRAWVGDAEGSVPIEALENVNDPGSNFIDLAIDEANGVFYATSVADGIISGRLDGTGPTNYIYDASSLWITTIILDTASQKLFLSDDYDNIFSLNTDGTGLTTLFSSGTGVSNPRGMAVNPSTGKIYWANRGTDDIYVGNMDGSGTPTVLFSGLNNPHHIDLDETTNQLYWVEEGGGNRIMTAPLDGSGTPQILYSNNSGRFKGIIVAPSSSYLPYSWSPNFNLSDPNNSYPYVSNPGVDTSYVLTITSPEGCILMDTVEVNVVVEIITMGRDTAICSGQLIDLNNLVTTNSSNILEFGTNFGNYDLGTSFVNPTTNSIYFVRDSSPVSGCVDTTFITVQVQPCDYGDLPDLSAGTSILDYRTKIGNNGPGHTILAGLSLGLTIDGETDGQQSAAADGDGADEDGLTFPNNLNIRPGVTINRPLSIINTTGIVAHLEGWIDWNGDGDFDDIGEIIVDISDDGMGDFGITHIPITVPSNAIQSQLIGVRFRLSHIDNMTPYGMVNSGEVEDYLIQVECPANICLPTKITIQRGNLND